MRRGGRFIGKCSSGAVHAVCDSANVEGGQKVEPGKINLYFCHIYVPFFYYFLKTGDKWSHLPDMSDWLLLPGHERHLLLWHVFSLVALHLVMTLSQRRSRSGFSSLVLGSCCVLVLLHNCAEGAFGQECKVDLFGTR